MGMSNREKVVKGLERCMSEQTCKGCPYKETNECEDRGYYYSKAIEDAIALLKEKNGNIGHLVVLENCSNAGVYCSECQTKIFDRYPMKKKYSYFCPHCGTRMEGQVVK